MHVCLTTGGVGRYYGLGGYLFVISDYPLTDCFLGRARYT